MIPHIAKGQTRFNVNSRLQLCRGHHKRQTDKCAINFSFFFFIYEENGRSSWLSLSASERMWFLNKGAILQPKSNFNSECATQGSPSVLFLLVKKKFFLKKYFLKKFLGEGHRCLCLWKVLRRLFPPWQPASDSAIAYTWRSQRHERELQCLWGVKHIFKEAVMKKNRLYLGCNHYLKRFRQHHKGRSLALVLKMEDISQPF